MRKPGHREVREMWLGSYSYKAIRPGLDLRDWFRAAPSLWIACELA